MDVVSVLIGLLIALQVGALCEQGETLGDWREWNDTHPYAAIVAEARYEGEFSFWLIDGDGSADNPSDEDGLVLFVFDMGNMPHGQCARQL
jgi:hypothetical protein